MGFWSLGTETFLKGHVRDLGRGHRFPSTEFKVQSPEGRGSAAASQHELRSGAHRGLGGRGCISEGTEGRAARPLSSFLVPMSPPSAHSVHSSALPHPRPRHRP